MIDLLRKVDVRFNNFICIEEGQDLVEYAFLIMILALGTIVSVPPLAAALAPMLEAVKVAL